MTYYVGTITIFRRKQILATYFCNVLFAIVQFAMILIQDERMD
jgi:hypothetical protein